MTALVVGNHTQGLGVVRSLGRVGITPDVLYDKQVCLSRFSRYCGRFQIAPRHSIADAFDPMHNDELIETMLAMVPNGEKAVLYGVNEDVIHLFYRRADDLRDRFLLPENDIESIVDKYLFAELTERLGIATPRTRLLSEMGAIDLGDSMWVAKGRVGNKFRSIRNIKGKLIQNGSDLEQLRGYLGDKVGENEVIIQRVIDPDEHVRVRSYCGFSVEGTVHAEFMYEKVRQSPDRFGTGTYNRSIFDCELAENGATILRALGYTGIFEIEFIRNSEDDGAYTVIEMNPRSWKCIALATACGRNLCEMHYRYLREGTLPEALPDYIEGKNWAHIATDVPSMLRQGRMDFGYKDMVFCDWDADDMLPFFAELLSAPLVLAKI